MRKLVASVVAAVTVTAMSISASFAQWPTTCVELNDIVEAHLGNYHNVGIYQRVFGNQAESACQRDHRTDVQTTFSWAWPNPTPTPESAPTEPTSPSTPPAASTVDPSPRAVHPDAGTSLENPMPIGQPLVSSGNWEVTVLSVISNANSIIAQTNQFNDPPDPGFQYVLARIRVYYRGSGIGSFHAVRLTPTAGGILYDAGVSCGVFPDRFYGVDIGTDRVREGNVCWHIKTADVPGLAMFDEWEDNRLRPSWWSLHE